MQQRKTNQFCTGLKQRLVSSLTLERFRDCRPHNRNRSRLFGEWLKNGVNNGKFTPNNRDVRCPPCLGYTPCLGCGADFLNTKNLPSSSSGKNEEGRFESGELRRESAFHLVSEGQSLLQLLDAAEGGEGNVMERLFGEEGLVRSEHHIGHHE